MNPCQARQNKSANKPDSELNEFETVRLHLCLIAHQVGTDIFASICYGKSDIGGE